MNMLLVMKNGMRQHMVAKVHDIEIDTYRSLCDNLYVIHQTKSYNDNNDD